ncbi:major facilitator superfamily domain-containing protein [Crucibulum laeve]|uniref:Major facilitator superfamily domain-containing protein n=1 Tax=Crucibulum laeve TaxID=68775 RepID=A0A5C3LRS3_9AGAR|nr:major facilitator superfamily domain-containing protein [Crucibulum laeve]
MALGAAVIGDIYKLEERGQAIGVFSAASLFGCAVAPPLGSITAAHSSWRVMQVYLGVLGFCAFICIVFCFPETSHPGSRGVERILAEGKRIPTWRPIFINPLQPLWLLRYPNLLAVSVAGCLVLLTDYVMMVPLPYTIGARYNITNEVALGAYFSLIGIGNMIGAPLVGRLSDRVVLKWREKRGGMWYPEDRLRPALFAALVPIPLSVLFSGLAVRYIPRNFGLVVNLCCLLLNGFGVVFALNPCSAYNVDVMHSRSA